MRPSKPFCVLKISVDVFSSFCSVLVRKCQEMRFGDYRRKAQMVSASKTINFPNLLTSQQVFVILYLLKFQQVFSFGGKINGRAI